MSDLIPIRLAEQACANLQAEIDRLKAENERLRKAGDAMYKAMWYGDAERFFWVKKFAETDWKLAKGGKQS